MLAGPKPKGSSSPRVRSMKSSGVFAMMTLRLGPQKLIEGLAAHPAGAGDQFVDLPDAGANHRNVGEFGDPLADRLEQGGALGAVGGGEGGIFNVCSR